MGGRSEYKPPEYTDREAWIMQVSDNRLATYERMINSPAAAVRADGSARNFHGEYMRDLVQREKARRAPK